MSPEADIYDLNELSDLAGVTPRTVRYYVQQGLLPSPGARGPGAKYDSRHLDRLNLIKRLQREHLPLAEIRRRLEALDDRAVHELVRSSPREPPRSSAVDYVRDVLAGRPARFASVAMMEVPGPPAGPGRVGVERSQWERITLAPDVELHVRRPLSREQNRLVERLMEYARELFEEDAP